MKALALQLGLPADSDEATIEAEIARLRDAPFQTACAVQLGLPVNASEAAIMAEMAALVGLPADATVAEIDAEIARLRERPFQAASAVQLGLPPNASEAEIMAEMASLIGLPADAAEGDIAARIDRLQALPARAAPPTPYHEALRLIASELGLPEDANVDAIEFEVRLRSANHLDRVPYVIGQATLALVAALQGECERCSIDVALNRAAKPFRAASRAVH